MYKYFTWNNDEYGTFASNYAVISTRLAIAKFGNEIIDETYVYSNLGLINGDHYSFTRDKI